MLKFTKKEVKMSNLVEKIKKIEELKAECNAIEDEIKLKISKLSAKKGYNWKANKIKNISIFRDNVSFVLYDNIYMFSIQEVEDIDS